MQNTLHCITGCTLTFNVKQIHAIRLQLVRLEEWVQKQRGVSREERALWKIVQWRVQELLKGGGGGKNLKGFFLAIQFFRGVGGPAQKMMFPTKKVAK